MKSLGANEIRQRFLDFFESKGHYSRSSYGLVPENDKSLLLINAGMAPLKNYFMGKEVPPNKRMATCQKCIRTGDIENVGRTARHATYFEMLGNFSFGDYFKKEATAWAWEFITKDLELPVDKIWVTVYEEDDEAKEIWINEVGVDPNKIVKLGKDDNFWEIGTGPCGPCSELYIDRGEAYGCGHADCKPGCDCDRFLEFWNLVFTQFDKDDNGVYNLLPNPNIDTGMGLERIACIMQGVDSIFDIDTMKRIREKVCSLANVEYGNDKKKDLSIRVITDHTRATTFMIGDGILPSNEGRGYVLRRLLRRAARHGKLLGITGSFLCDIMEVVIDVNKAGYPVLEEKKEYIAKVLSVEEERFQETIDQGMEILKSFIDETKKQGSTELKGEHAFKLYDTYGFPIDLTKEILEEENLTVDEVAFEREMQEQRERARSARANMEGEGWKEDVFSKIDQDIKTEFKGYETNSIESTLKAIVKGNEIVDSLQTGEEGTLIFDVTPFYGEGGGQVGDKGIIRTGQFKALVIDTKKGINDRIHHIVKVEEGSIKVEENATLTINEEVRLSTARNHSATHILHKVLKLVLGDHVQQAGSLVNPERLRFDFTHFESISKEDIKKIEALVNQEILASLKINAVETSIDEARKMGATALFGEKYGDTVRVVSMGDFSMELCGGTHLSNTAQIGIFKIISETGIAAGVRRIEGITGVSTYKYLLEKEELIRNMEEIFKVKEENLLKKAESTLAESKTLSKELQAIKAKEALASMDDVLAKVEDVEGIKFIGHCFDNATVEDMRNSADYLKDKIGSGVIVLASREEEKVSLLVAVTDDLTKKKVHAGNIIKEIAPIAGGKGGGRPNMAQAGGKEPQKAAEAVNRAKEVLKGQIQG